MNPALRIGCAALLIGLAVFLIWGHAPGSNPSYSNNEGVSSIMTSSTAQPPKYALHVLFIGNSYTFVHDIPREMVDIASSDPGNPTQFIVQSVTRGAVGLRELWTDGNALAALKARHWDYVVLQENSFWAMTSGNIEESQEYFAKFDQAIKENHAKTILYLTWPREPGSSWYTDPKYSFLQNPTYMMERFAYNTDAEARKLGALVSPVGLYWFRTLKAQPPIKLYGPDNHHPGPAGAYLAALVFYKTLTGRDVTKITMIPAGVAPKDAAMIKTIVSQPLSQQ